MTFYGFYGRSMCVFKTRICILIQRIAKTRLSKRLKNTRYFGDLLDSQHDNLDTHTTGLYSDVSSIYQC